MTARIHVLTPALPLRAVLVSAVLAIIGTALIVVPSAMGLPVVLNVIGWVALVAAVALLVAAAVSWLRMRVTIEFTDEGYSINGPGAREEGRWADVTKVTQARASLTIHRGPQGRVSLVSPRGVTNELIDLVADLTQRLDASRGYRELS